MAIFKSSYYDKDYRAGAALLRARRPYLFKNAATGIALFAFCIGVYAFTINAVGQDDFSDVIVPEKKMVDAEPAPAVK
ncbi:uncharacterized protein PADG_02463 [Paracoccidioides brasiliensis Pb18]|uniref:Cytochrome c oxidase assembly factor 3 n=2 Tax=Paracoccidioides brasiliensis TaxID=121759 RepID=C1G5K8_PARBD|nr:uncharacterized protein PADG_02463 [Paracoccidioides brasiliensis Pb18]EEH46365.1 hypothetical protein PADG_02463 [Paracoccidioides brasiliensis Pb18]ODH45170.1 hypothetical protein ACO22_00283 [Paracoccidioides brasiliensis]ODH52528.1 hypothetical protein GX48_01308 [Paracoccidioides brasiliensis]